METAVYVSGFLLLLFISGAQLSPEHGIKFGKVGGSAGYSSWGEELSNYSLLYSVSADGHVLLLANCSGRSQPDGPKADGYEVTCDYSQGYSCILTNLTMSQTGDYRTEGWKGRSFTGHSDFHLIVCEEGKGHEGETVYDDDSAVLCRFNSTLGNGRSLQVYRHNRLVLDTNSSLEPLVEDLKGRLQVDLNTSLVTLSGVTLLDNSFYCSVWKGPQCQRYYAKSLSRDSTSVFAHNGENITLPCTFKRDSPLEQFEVYWGTPTGHHKFTMEQQEVMYRTQTGNYSLFIPSVSQEQSGRYECRWMTNEGDGSGHDNPIQIFYLYVCPLVFPLDVMFSHGETVHLNYTAHLNFSSVDGIMWYRQKVLEPQVLILDSRKGSASLPEDLRGRVSLRGQVSWRGRETYKGKLTKGERLTNSPLILSNLTAEDSGVYTWRVYGRELKIEDECRYRYEYNCTEGSFRLVYMDPFGVHSLFYRAYAPLLGCGLLGLVAVVIWFKLRSRRGEQTSGRQSREGQQSGDEDLYENVEMAEISG